MVSGIGLLYSEAETVGMARCRARTENGTGPLCKNPVREAGLRCHKHQGLPEAPPRIRAEPRRTPTRPTGTRSQRPAPRRTPAERRADQVREASEYCADVISSGWKDTV